MAAISKSYKKALKYLDSRILQLSGSGSDRLPGIRNMAKDAGVALVTMWKGVAEYKRAGKLVVRPAVPGGIMLPAKDDAGLLNKRDTAAAVLPEQSHFSQEHAWLRVKKLILTDIEMLSAASSGELPTGKELATRYATSYATVKKALASLLFDGFIVQSRRGYRRQQAPRPSGRSVILFVTVTDQMNVLSVFMPWSHEFWHRLEMTLQEQALSFRLQDYNTTMAMPASAVADVLGFAVWMPGLGAQRIETVVPHLNRFGLPTAVLDEEGRYHIVPAVKGNPLFRFFSLAAGRTAGRDVGHYLYSSGHRATAYFMHSATAGIFRDRLEGIDDVFNKAGITAGVTVFPVESGELESAFRSALAHDEITAWICMNDRFAMQAQQFLHDHKPTAGREISLVGFDDTIEAFGNGVTSYNFNLTAAVNAIIEHILSGPAVRSRRCKAGQLVEIPGRVMVRTSSTPLKS